MYIYIYIYIYSLTLLILPEHLPCKPAAETALQPLIWHSESSPSHACFSPEVCFFTDAGMETGLGKPSERSCGRLKTIV